MTSCNFEGTFLCYGKDNPYLVHMVIDQWATVRTKNIFQNKLNLLKGLLQHLNICSRSLVDD